MAKRMAELIATRFQTSAAYTAGYDNCSSDAAIVSANRGFTGPCCTKGAAWSADGSCQGQVFERFSAANYRGTWTCDSEQQSLTANDDAAPGGVAIGFARLQGIQQPPPSSSGLKLVVGIKLAASNDSATCAYRYSGVAIGMGAKEGAAGSDFRDEFNGYTVTLTPPDCTGEDAKLSVARHDVGPGRSTPVFTPLGSYELAASGVSTGEWQQLQVAANATHISVGLDGVGAHLLEVALLPGKPIGCGQSLSADRLAATEPWEHANVVDDACSVGVYMHRATTSWRALSFAGDANQMHLNL